ncbi:GAF domain-containing protein [Halarchaeum sp. P4]|uniref:GAF domain-containing protein n=1 Tax=Halarchaeum sp. P4 TaxID=3421639 RepID=UPI003EB6EBAD
MILCVDPDPNALAATSDALADAGYETATATSVAEAREVLAGDADVDAVVTEYVLPDGTGLDFVRTVRERSPDTACLLFTATPVADVDTAAFGDVVADYLSKDDPDAHAALRDAVGQALAFRSQTAYPLPEDEDARLAALDRYALDPAALGDSLDRLAEIATALFGVDAAAVGLIDAHEQRFLTCHGISLGTLDREDTVCTYALLDEGVTVIEDVRTDARFEENEGLAEAGIAFYASAPLVTPDERKIGTFCVYDDEPRSFDERERELLGLLADEAMEQLELRRERRDDGSVDDA